MGPISKTLFGLCMAACVSAQASPLRLSVDALSAAPTAEPVQAQRASASDEERQPGDDLSFVAAPELAFPVMAADAAPADADWLLAARSAQEDAAAADRQLGDFAPQVPAPLVPSADPIDEVKIAASNAGSASAAQAALQEPVAVPDRTVLVWMVVPTLALALGLAWWADRRSGGRRRHRRLATR